MNRVTAAEAAAILGLSDSRDPAAAARRKLRRRGVTPVGRDLATGRVEYDRAAVDAEATATPPRPGRPRTAHVGPDVTLSFGHTEVLVDLGQLTPVARALAETMSAQPLTGTARAAIMLRSRRPLRELVPDGEQKEYAVADLDAPDQQVWRGWAPWHPATDDIHAWLEYEATRLPAGYVPVRPQMRSDWQAPSADAALGEVDELLSRDQAMALVRHLGARISLEQWRNEQAAGAAPKPALFVEGGQPRWSRAQVTRYALKRK